MANCKNCGSTGLTWQKSRSGNFYLTNTPNERDFHSNTCPGHRIDEAPRQQAPITGTGNAVRLAVDTTTALEKIGVAANILVNYVADNYTDPDLIAPLGALVRAILDAQSLGVSVELSSPTPNTPPSLVQQEIVPGLRPVVQQPETKPLKEVVAKPARPVTGEGLYTCTNSACAECDEVVFADLPSKRGGSPYRCPSCGTNTKYLGKNKG